MGWFPLPKGVTYLYGRAHVSRLLQRLRAHGLIAKLPRSPRYRLTQLGHQVMSAAIHLANDTMPTLLQPQMA